MRIVGGRFKGHGLSGPPAAAGRGPSPIRPTSDRLREALFNILVHNFGDRLAGARVIDLFAGTGALGLEALSRGAKFGLFVDRSSAACATIGANIARLGVGGASRVVRRDATRLGQAPSDERFSLAFLDPPYGRDLASGALAQLRDGYWLAPEALCVVEEAASTRLSEQEGFGTLDQRRFGDTQVVLLRFASVGAPAPPAAHGRENGSAAAE